MYLSYLITTHRLAISLDDKIVFHTPRLVMDPKQEPIAGTLTVDGVLKAFYVTDGPLESGAPTFVSSW